MMIPGNRQANKIRQLEERIRELEQGQDHLRLRETELVTDIDALLFESNNLRARLAESELERERLIDTALQLFSVGCCGRHAENKRKLSHAKFVAERQQIGCEYCAAERIAELATENKRLREREAGEVMQEALDDMQVRLAELEAENWRLRDALDEIESAATVECQQLSKIARRALEESLQETDAREWGARTRRIQLLEAVVSTVRETIDSYCSESDILANLCTSLAKLDEGTELNEPL